MAEAYIIDAVRTPRSIGKMGKGALSTMHPEHLSASVMAALRDRNNLDTADVDDVIWGVSGNWGSGRRNRRNAALDARLRVRRRRHAQPLLRQPSPRQFRRRMSGRHARPRIDGGME